MKIEIYQIGNMTPIVLECDSWFIDCGNTPKINTYKDRKRNAVFFVNNIAGFKEISEDDELKEATTEAIREFAERLKCGVSITSGLITCNDIDNLVKAMAGDTE